MSFTRRDMLATSAAALAVGALPASAKAPLGAGQAPGFFRMKLGSYEVIALNDGLVQPPLPKGFVRNASDEDVAKALTEIGLPKDKLSNTFTAIAVNTGDKVVLFDTGFADNGPPSTGNIVKQLAAAGIEAKDVDTVVYSHFHGDHINGTRKKDGTATFPNAELMVPEPEWAFWMDDAKMAAAPDGMKGGFQGVRRVFGPVAKDVTRFAWGKEILPGITAVQADGHTPGHTAFTIASGNDRMIYVADITHNPLIFARRPEWQAMFDMDAAKAIETRKKLLDMASAENMRMSFYHASFPATGFILKDGPGYEFMPALWQAG